MTTFVGLDVSKATIDFAIQQKKGYKQGRISNDLAGYKKLAMEIDKFENVKLICETTGIYSFPVVNFLSEHGYFISEVHAFSIHNYKKTVLQKAKTDAVDAREICNFGARYEDRLTSYTVRTKEILELGFLIRMRENLMMSRKRLMGINESISFLTSDRLLNLDFDFPRKGLNYFSKELDEFAKSSLRGITKYCLEHFEPTYKALNTIKGVGEVLIPYLIYYTNDFTKFKSARDFTAYIGLVPNRFESGTSVNSKPRIASKAGVNSVLRSSLVMATNTAVRFNPDCKMVFERLRPDMPYKQKLVAASRKLAVIIHKCGKEKISYVPYTERDIVKI